MRCEFAERKTRRMLSVHLFLFIALTNQRCLVSFYRQLSSSRTEEDAAVAARVSLAGAAATGVDEASRRAASGAAYAARDARRKSAVSSGVTASGRDGDAWELEEEEEEEGYQEAGDAAEEWAEVEEVTQERQRRYRHDGEVRVEGEGAGSFTAYTML